MPAVTRFPAEGRHVRLSPDAAKAAWTSDAGLHIGDALRAPGAVAEVLQWSPDGACVAASLAGSEGPGGRRTVRWIPDHVGDPSGSTPGASFAWEPKGVWLVVADPWGGAIRRHCTETDRAQDVCPLVDDGDPLQAPAFAVSPDGLRLAFTTLRAGENRAELRLVDLPSGEPRTLTELPHASVKAVPFWTPDSGSLGLLLVDLELGASAILFVRGLEGEGELLYASELLLPPRTPAWSPTGKPRPS